MNHTDGLMSGFGNKTETAGGIKMKKCIFVIGLLGLALGICRLPLAAAEEGFVYTANERGDSISVINVGTGQVKTIATRITPHNVQVSRNGRLLLAVGPVADGAAKKKMTDEGKMERGRLLIIDAEKLAIESAADIEIGRHPAHVIIDAQGKLAYVSNSEDDNVLVIDVAQKKVVSEIKTGKFPHGLRMSPNGREIFVANVNDNSVSIIDVAQSKEVTRMPVGKAPVQVAFTPDGARVYVSLRDENNVAVIDTAQRKKIAAVTVGRNPIQVFGTPDGRYVYAANQGTEADPDNTVSVIETASNSVVATLVTGKGAHGVVVSDDGKRVFVANLVDDTVSVIDTATQKVTKSIKVGQGPNGITFRRAVPVREFRLVAQETTWELLPGVAVKAWTYNGQVPGPEIRVTEGERVRVVLENKLPAPTTIHWHGLIIPASMDGVPGVSMEAVKTGESFTYEFVVTHPGTFWYHPHVDSLNQISKGLYGAFIVEPMKRDLKIDREVTLIMSDWVVPSKSESAEAMSGGGGKGGMDSANYYTINGKSAPAIPPMKVKQGERILIRFINAGNAVHPMHLHGHAYEVVATDGYRLPSTVWKDTLPINAGERFDVIVAADNPGTWAFHCHDLHHVTNDGKYPGGLLLLFQYK